MVGVPGSGKSYYAQKMCDKNTVVVSSDQVRKDLFGDENFQGNNAAVFDEVHRRIKKHIENKKNVIVDATNINRKARKSIINTARSVDKCCRIFACVIATPVNQCIYQDSKRERCVGPEVINKFIRKFEFPQKFEGINDVIIMPHNVENSEYNEATVEKLRSEMNMYDQKNRHHIYTVGEHCKRVADYYKDNMDAPEYEAGLWHDVGKMFTQTIDQNGEAHYYNHDSVSTYYVVSHPQIIKNKQNIEQILFFINYHMRMHRDIAPGTAAGKDYKQMFGENLYNRLYTFSIADRNATGTVTSV